MFRSFKLFRVRTKRNKSLVILATAAVTVLSASQVLADRSGWKLYSFNPSGRALASKVVDVADGTASFTFPTTSDAAYVTTSKFAVGDRTGDTLAADVSVAAPGGTTFANYPGCSGATTNPTLGLYFRRRQQVASTLLGHVRGSGVPS